MIKIIYVADPEGGKLTMRAEGHAGYAPAGQDIVCAAVSCLMQTLAYALRRTNTPRAASIRARKARC